MSPQPSFGLFSLFAAFDLVGVFAVYIICLQLMGQPIRPTLAQEVFNYSFYGSLFDCVINASFRMFVLLFVHAIYKSTSLLAVSMTTTVTTAFTIVKVFLYHYPYGQVNNQTFVYILIFSNLLVAWVELWLFVAIIHNPAKQQAAIRHRRDSSFVVVGSDDLEQSRHVRTVYGAMATSERYFSAAGSDDGGTIESDNHRGKLVSLKEDDELLSLTEEDKALLSCKDTCLRLTDEIFRLAYDSNVLWRPLSGFDDCTSVCIGDSTVVSPEFRINAPIFRIVLDLHVPFDTLKQVLIDEIVDMPRWHPFVPESKLIEKLDLRDKCAKDSSPFIEITYQTSQPALGGFVSARDFVNMRYVGTRDGIVYGISIGSAHKNCAPRQGYVRGETGPCGYFLVSADSPYINKIRPQPITTAPLTRFVWIVNTDVKGGLPSSIVNKAMQYAIRRFISDLRTHLANLRGAVSPPTSPQMFRHSFVSTDKLLS